MNIDKKQMTLLSVVGIATLLAAIIGATFAWFSATVTGNDTASSVTVTTATLGISYTNGNEIKMLKIFPGTESGEKAFTIQSVGATVDQQYYVNWEVSVFDFADKSDLVYSLRGTTEGSGLLIPNKTDEPMPTTIGTTTIGTGTLKPDETHTYYLNVKFKETGSDQNSNQSKNFQGKISVSTPTLSGS